MKGSVYRYALKQISEVMGSVSLNRLIASLFITMHRM